MERLHKDTKRVFSLHSIRTFNKTAIPNTQLTTLKWFAQLLSRKLTFKPTNLLSLRFNFKHFIEKTSRIFITPGRGMILTLSFMNYYFSIKGDRLAYMKRATHFISSRVPPNFSWFYLLKKGKRILYFKIKFLQIKSYESLMSGSSCSAFML